MISQQNVPNEKEIEQLPRWARVAFAARCARRVQPLFAEFWPRVPKHIKAVKNAVDMAEKTAALGLSNGIDYVDYEDMADAAGEAAGYAGAGISAEVAYAGAEAVASISTSSADICREAVEHAFKAADGLNDENRKFQIINGIRQDFDHLLKLAQENHWGDETPVSPEVFMPIGKE